MKTTIALVFISILPNISEKQAIKPKFFADFEIDLLPMEDQKKIAALNKLARRERFLLTALAREKEKYYATVIDGLQDKMIRRCGI